MLISRTNHPLPSGKSHSSRNQMDCANTLRIDNCDEQLVYKNGDIFGTKGDTYTRNISSKRSNLSLSYDVVKLLTRLKLKEK